MNAALATLRRIQQAGFTLSAEGGRLIVEPGSQLTDEQRACIREHKAALVALLSANDSAYPLTSPVVEIAPQEEIGTDAKAALAILQKLHTEHRQRLIDGGHSPRSAMVHRHDYWKALRQAGIPPDEVAFDLAEAGQVRVLADGLYWIPVEAQP